MNELINALTVCYPFLIRGLQIKNLVTRSVCNLYIDIYNIFAYLLRYLFVLKDNFKLIIQRWFICGSINIWICWKRTKI